MLFSIHARNQDNTLSFRMRLIEPVINVFKMYDFKAMVKREC